MKIPTPVNSIISKLEKKGFSAHIVGGCVRDFLIGKTPDDWDVATNAKPEEVQKIFPDSFYENDFLTVTVQTKSKNPTLKEVEITTYRFEATYSDRRHPDKVQIAKTLEEDLSRRDFTMNAIAMDNKGNIVDPFDGQKDIEDKLIRAVGKAKERFSEDALRMMRTARFATVLDFKIEPKTKKAIIANASLLKHVSQERIRDEIVKIIMSQRAASGIELLRELKLLKYIIPELEEGYGVEQNKHHTLNCYDHNLASLKFAAKSNFNKLVRISALLHDVGKPRTKRGKGKDSTFYGHEVVGAQMTKKILERLKFSKKDIRKIVKLVRYHLFYYHPDEVGDASVRKLTKNVGLEDMPDLIKLRMADRIGSGCPKAKPYKLRYLEYVIEKISRDPISVKMLKVSGNDIIKQLDIKPGPKIGQILNILLSYVLEDPKKNKKKLLKEEIDNLNKLSESKLKALFNKTKKEVENIEIKGDKMTKDKYWVK